MISLQFDAYAKINWSIMITGKRPDGYHTLRSLMQKIDLADSILIQEWERDICFRDGVEAGADLSLSAWMLLKEQFQLPECLRIDIQKRIPIGGGLGGGSCDAAAVLNALNREFDLGLSAAELQKLGLKLGADMPYCLSDGLALVEGIGEQVTPSIGSACDLFLCGPGKPVSTIDVYRCCDDFIGQGQRANIDELEKSLAIGCYENISALWGNDLMDAACHVEPELLKIQKLFKQHGIPCMLSGSGGTFFAIADRNVETLKRIQEQVPWSTFASTMV